MYTAHFELAYCEHEKHSMPNKLKEREKVDTTSLIEILSSQIDVFILYYQKQSVTEVIHSVNDLNKHMSQRWFHTLSSSTSSFSDRVVLCQYDVCSHSVHSWRD